jgi:hypothetical protein
VRLLSLACSSCSGIDRGLVFLNQATGGCASPTFQFDMQLHLCILGQDTYLRLCLVGRHVLDGVARALFDTVRGLATHRPQGQRLFTPKDVEGSLVTRVICFESPPVNSRSRAKFVPCAHTARHGPQSVPGAEHVDLIGLSRPANAGLWSVLEQDSEFCGTANNPSLLHWLYDRRPLKQCGFVGRSSWVTYSITNQSNRTTRRLESCARV